MITIFDKSAPTEDQRRAILLGQLHEIRYSVVELASHMADKGDDREFDIILRSLRRMLSGETNVSGEVLAIVGELTWRNRRLKFENPNVEWRQDADGDFFASIGDWDAYVTRQKRNMWRLTVRWQVNGFSPPWSHNLDTAEEAKDKALMWIEGGKAEMARNAYNALRFARISSGQ
ncbi:MAG: hypothetical protein V4712_12360 [Pseudomonadota bacterium]